MKSFKFGICKQGTFVPRYVRENYPQFVKCLIDVGAGYGDKVRHLHAVRKVAVEPFEKFAKFIRDMGIDVVRAVAEYLPIRDGVADCVLYTNVVMFVSDKEATYSEIRRIAKAGAIIIFSYYNAKTSNIKLTYAEFVTDAKKMGTIVKTGKSSDTYYAIIRS